MNGGIVLMTTIKQTSSFIRNLKRLKKKHFPIELIKGCVIAILENDEKVLTKIKDHSLKGKWQGYREFHPSRYGNYGKAFDNWIVIYKYKNDEFLFILVDVGSHEILNG